VNIANFDLQPLQTYLIENRPVHMKSGELSLKGNFRLRDAPAKNEPRMKFDGEMSVANLATIDTNSNLDFVKWKMLRSHPSLFTSPDRLEIERIEAQQPYGRFLIDIERRLNIISIMSFGSRPSATPRPKGEAPTPVIIRSIVVHEGPPTFQIFPSSPIFRHRSLGWKATLTACRPI
jgi:hypothetical protein